jgi:hypothetical protein
MMEPALDVVGGSDRSEHERLSPVRSNPLVVSSEKELPEDVREKEVSATLIADGLLDWA